MRTGIVLLARLASTRLPAKTLAPIGRRVILEHCLQRLIASGVGRVILATTTRDEDDVLARIARRYGALVTRGDGDDVLGRTWQAAQEFDLELVLRATGDNPGVDIQTPGRVVAALRATGADYVVEEGLPYGAAVEGMTAAALEYAADAATDPYDREHVTTFIRRRTDLFRVVMPLAPAPLRRPELRLTVDTAEDLAWLRELFARSGSDIPSLRELIEVAGRAGHAVHDEVA